MASVIKTKKEKILSTIILKYFCRPKKSNKREKSGINCVWCLDKDIVNIGGGFRDEEGNIHQICEDCAVLRYKEDLGFKSLAAARARRRRIFDVGYLFSEMVVDRYMEIYGLHNFSDIEEGLATNIFIEAGKMFNSLFDKEGKIKIEETESQKEIEQIFRDYMKIIDFTVFFRDSGLI